MFVPKTHKRTLTDNPRIGYTALNYDVRLIVSLNKKHDAPIIK